MKEIISNLLRSSPGLRGREIAKVIGEDKTVVNSFLSKNLDSFQRNEEYRWYCKSAGEVAETIVELSTGWIDSQAFEALLAEYKDLFQESCGIKFIIPKGCNLFIASIARLLALLNQLAYQEKRVTIDMTECGKTKSFLNRAGFFDHLHQSIVVLPRRPRSSTADKYKGGSDTLVEFGAIDPNGKNKALIVQLIETFISKSSGNFQIAASTVFSEMIGNVSEHSDSPIEGFAALQCYDPKFKKKHIQTVISDSGLGVVATLRKTLEQNYPKLNKKYNKPGIDSDVGLVLEVFLKGNVSRFGAGRGLGFKSSREQAIKFDADLSIRQETFNVDFVYRNGGLVSQNVSKNLTKILGTHICFDFYVD